MSDNNILSRGKRPFIIGAVFVFIGLVVGIHFVSNRFFESERSSGTVAGSETANLGPSSTSRPDNQEADTSLAKTDEKGSDGGLGTGVYAWDAVEGSPDAPVTIIEYASWTCPFCRDFHLNTYKKDIEPAIEAGQVRYIPRDLLRNGVDIRVSLAARCEGVDFKSANDTLFQNFGAYTSGINALDQLDLALVQILSEQGMTAEKYGQCLRDMERAQFIKHVSDEASSMGVTSTPTVFINGKRINNATLATLGEQIADALKKKK